MPRSQFERALASVLLGTLVVAPIVLGSSRAAAQDVVETMPPPASPPQTPAATGSVTIGASTTGSATEATPPKNPPARAEAPPPAKPAPVTEADDGNPWYQPQPGDPVVSNLHKRRRPRLYNLGVLVDGHAFLANSIGTHAALGGDFNAGALELRVRFGTPLLGVSVGGLFPSAPNYSSGMLSVGMDLNRMSGVPLNDVRSNVTFWLALPSLEPRLFFRPTFGKGAFAVGTALTGVRMVWKSFAFEVRAPRFDVWAGPFDSRFELRASLGGGGQVSYVF